MQLSLQPQYFTTSDEKYFWNNVYRRYELAYKILKGLKYQERRYIGELAHSITNSFHLKSNLGNAKRLELLHCKKRKEAMKSMALWQIHVFV